ncbi:hypothetical protein CAPTEDRAFT_194665 [Capitella teleta]|uniref:Uncharacterized protein n=1 Tax=Capitella teleta TaxID=283909 RepID=R7UC39_CAPTE|nr:hypothetical protein CAPTEDRAFT_194665 [Capitella teleta]|eukprot:ELU00832.1 hypothetical protein CAPTEDRAFT_194665 [Capitella teleta]
MSTSEQRGEKMGELTKEKATQGRQRIRVPRYDTSTCQNGQTEGEIEDNERTFSKGFNADRQKCRRTNLAKCRANNWDGGADHLSHSTNGQMPIRADHLRHKRTSLLFTKRKRMRGALWLTFLLFQDEKHVHLPVNTQDASITSAVKERAAKKAHAIKFEAFTRENSDMPFPVKRKVFDAALTSTILYSCETWLCRAALNVASYVYAACVKTLFGFSRFAAHAGLAAFFAFQQRPVSGEMRDMGATWGRKSGSEYWCNSREL